MQISATGYKLLGLIFPALIMAILAAFLGYNSLKFDHNFIYTLEITAVLIGPYLLFAPYQFWKLRKTNSKPAIERLMRKLPAYHAVFYSFAAFLGECVLAIVQHDDGAITTGIFIAVCSPAITLPVGYLLAACYYVLPLEPVQFNHAQLQ